MTDAMRCASTDEFAKSVTRHTRIDLIERTGTGHVPCRAVPCRAEGGHTTPLGALTRIQSETRPDPNRPDCQKRHCTPSFEVGREERGPGKAGQQEMFLS